MSADTNWQDVATEAEVLHLKYQPEPGQFPAMPNAYDFSRLAALVAAIAKDRMSDS